MISKIHYCLIYYESIFCENCSLQAISLAMMDFMKSKEYGEAKIHIYSTHFGDDALKLAQAIAKV